MRIGRQQFVLQKSPCLSVSVPPCHSACLRRYIRSSVSLLLAVVQLLRTGNTQRRRRQRRSSDECSTTTADQHGPNDARPPRPTTIVIIIGGGGGDRPGEGARRRPSPALPGPARLPSTSLAKLVSGSNNRALFARLIIRKNTR